MGIKLLLVILFEGLDHSSPIQLGLVQVQQTTIHRVHSNQMVIHLDGGVCTLLRGLIQAGLTRVRSIW
jgi:hypothetical protein